MSAKVFATSTKMRASHPEPLRKGVSVRLGLERGESSRMDMGRRRSSANEGLNTLLPASLQKKRKVIANICESQPFQIFMTIISLWSLFSDDIRLSSTTKDSDLGFTVVISIIFFIFLFEIIATIYYKEEYFLIPSWSARKNKETNWRLWLRRIRIGSFYFWLDCVATFSLILEVTPI
jgi:hypothetical protein